MGHGAGIVQRTIARKNTVSQGMWGELITVGVCPPTKIAVQRRLADGANPILGLHKGVHPTVHGGEASPDKAPIRASFVWLATRSSSEVWWRAGELNPRPLRCERSALPTELAPHPWDIGNTTYESRRVCCTGSCSLIAAVEERGGILSRVPCGAIIHNPLPSLHQYLITQERMVTILNMEDISLAT